MPPRHCRGRSLRTGSSAVRQARLAAIHDRRSEGARSDCAAAPVCGRSDGERGLVDGLPRKDVSNLPSGASCDCSEYEGEGCACSFLRDTTELRLTEHKMELWARQHAIVAELGQYALAGADLDSLLESCASAIARGLDVEFSSVLQVHPPLFEAQLVAGCGWAEGMVGSAKVPLSEGTLSKYTLDAQCPIIIEDLREETRFIPSPILPAYGITSGITISVNGPEHPWGILAAFTVRRRLFAENDANFLNMIANILMTAIERRRQEAELRMQISAINAASDQIVIVNANGKIQFVNPAFERISGMSAESLIGRDASVLFIGDFNSAVIEDIRTAVRSGKRWYGEIRFPRKDGSLCIEDVVVTPVMNEVGVMQHAIAILRDVTERRVHDEALNRSRRLETVGKMAAGIAHDLNNVLQMVTGYVHLLMQHHGEDDLAKSDLQKIRTACQRAAEMVNHILTFSRQVQPRIESVDVSGIIREAVELLGNTLPRTIRIRCILPHSECFAMADPSQLSQVIVNLCLNARDAMPDGGKLEIKLESVRLDGGPCGEDPLVPAGEYVRCIVRDDGCGMDEETRRRAFEPFFTTKPQGEGTGLGLSTCYGIVRNHGGFLDIQSSPGKGTAVIVYLPCTDRRPDSEDLRPVDSAVGGDETILLVDDEEYIREFTQRILEHHGYKVMLASNGYEALDQLALYGSSIDLVLLDLNMPEMDGTQVLSVFRELAAGKVLVTTGLDPGVQDLPPSHRPDGVLQKPYTPDTLLSKIRETLTGP